MTSRAAAKAALLLPLHLLSAALGPRFSCTSAAPLRWARSAAALLAVASLLTAICAMPDAGANVEADADADADALRLEIEALRLKVARLESLLEANAKTLDSKVSILEEDNKLNEAMEREIQLLMNEPDSTKNSQSKSYSAGNIKSMEDEVQQLQHEVSKINRNSYATASVARDTEKRVESLSLEVKKIEDMTAEQWIQIRQLEQAFVLTKMMTSKVFERSKPSDTVYKWPGKEIIVKYVRSIKLDGIYLRGASYARSCFSHTYKRSRSFVQAISRCYHETSRFRKAICRQYISDINKPDVFFLGGTVSKSSISLPYNQFKIFISSAQKFHYKAQVFISDAMESNKYSSGLSNEPVTFILAYLLLISPMWIAWFIYSTWFSSRK
ncbi:uncharacterized protein LOC110434987 isoform X1 [Sorghum bicolor]|uniref:SUN domain-containing protein n=2 Tax=Sorghum bicolor TaxID=4558 RepID=A0A194YPI6_SORBI|nr:uncharacterized protein LOC110434987 isoform X1 [Sorghum bicolor]KXG30143.1 hypothetical protein SORBI_3004G137500 [Sorghum bicolor]|eukprot:XP_021315834.1 uncharacterized protein LOC110434987 isoform X1 [Sorghum bicolor]